jgi:hypothetical protein
MVFISTFAQAMMILRSIENGKCNKQCRSSWMRNLKYALETNSNPLKLTSVERKTMLNKMKELSGKRTSKKATKKDTKKATKKDTKKATKKSSNKYKIRNSPPFPANEHCGKIKKGNDGNMYKSVKDKNNVCRWKKQ